jgi:hypothetical protein
MFLEKPDDADHIYSSIFSDINRRYSSATIPPTKNTTASAGKPSDDPRPS